MPVRQPLELVRQALHDKTLSPQTLAFKMVVQCRRAVQLATAESITRGYRKGVDTPGLEWYLGGLWYWFMEIIVEDSSRLDFFVDVLVALRARYNEDTEWIIWGKPFNWRDLESQRPLGLVIAEIMRRDFREPPHDQGQSVDPPWDEKLGESILAGDPPPDTPEGRGWARSRARWLNHNTFCARLWALGMFSDPSLPMALINVYLEPLSLPEDGWRSRPGRPRNPHELNMEAAMTWLRIAGARMFVCRKTWDPNDNSKGTAIPVSFGTWKGVCGYHPDRWVYWKGILRALVQGEKGEWRSNVMEAAKSTLEAMEKVETEARGLQN